MFELLAEIGAYVKRIFQFEFLSTTEIVDFSNASAATGTWYTVLSSNETGKITELRGYTADGNQYIEIEVTKDGGVAKTYTVSSSNIVGGWSVTSGTTLVIPTNIQYNSSILIRIRHTSPSPTARLDSFVIREVI